MVWGTEELLFRDGIEDGVEDVAEEVGGQQVGKDAFDRLPFLFLLNHIQYLSDIFTLVLTRAFTAKWSYGCC